MALLSDVVKWRLILVCLEIVLTSTQDRCTVWPIHYGLINHFGFTRWYTDMTWVKWILVSVQLEIVLVLTQDRSMVSAERTIVSEISLDAPDGTPR